MGNVGHALNSCGITDTIGFGRTTAGVIRLQGIEPWPARELVKENLTRQSELARRHPLNQVPVEVGMNWFKDTIGGWFSKARLTRDVFVDRATELLVSRKIRHTAADRMALYDIFDSMDYDYNGELSVGEWAAGLTVFFKGNMEQCIHAVFDVLDTNGDKSLSKSELMEYLKPFVNAMTPPEADALRPLLTKKASDDIFQEMDFDHNEQISSDEMLYWSKQGNNIIDRLAKIIDHEVYSIWIAEKDKERRNGYKAPRKEYINGGPPPQQRQAWEQTPNQGRPYGGGGGPSPYPGNYGGGPSPYDGIYGGGPTYMADYSPPPYGRGGGGYGRQDPSDYRDLPRPPPPGYGAYEPRAHSFITDHHHDSAFGGGY